MRRDTTQRRRSHTVQQRVPKARTLAEYHLVKDENSHRLLFSAAATASEPAPCEKMVTLPILVPELPSAWASSQMCCIVPGSSQPLDLKLRRRNVYEVHTEPSLWQTRAPLKVSRGRGAQHTTGGGRRTTA